MPGVIALVTLFSFLSLFHAVTSCRPLSSFVRAEIAELYHTSLGTVPSDLTNVDHIDTPAKDERDTGSEESGLTSLHMLSCWVEHTVRHRRFVIRRGALVQLVACRSMSVQFSLLRTLHASLAVTIQVPTLNVELCSRKLHRCRVRRCDGAPYRRLVAPAVATVVIIVKLIRSFVCMIEWAPREDHIQEQPQRYRCFGECRNLPDWYCFFRTTRVCTCS
jgi:hypothetical protein